MRERWCLIACFILLTACGDDPAPMADGGVCTAAADCDDGVFCNGVESCESGRCTAGERPCGDAPL